MQKGYSRFMLPAIIILIAFLYLYVYHSDTLSVYIKSSFKSIGQSIGPQAPPKPNVTISTLELQVYGAINEQRKLNGLAVLKWNSELSTVARSHSQYLANLNLGFTTNIYISHNGVNKTTHAERLANSSIYYYSASGENIHGTSLVKSHYLNEERTPVAYYTQEEMVNNSVQGWMNSPGHRRNILEDFDETGIGIAQDDTRTNYVFTQLFIKRAECGYKGGQCCTKPGYYPFCFIPLNCEDGICR